MFKEKNFSARLRLANDSDAEKYSEIRDDPLTTISEEYMEKEVHTTQSGEHESETVTIWYTVVKYKTRELL